MSKLNELSRLQTGGNTGAGAIFLDPGSIVGAFLCPKNFEIDTTSFTSSADMQTALIAATHATSKSARIYPIYDFLTPKDSTEQKTVQTFNTGAKKPVREGYNDWSFQYVQGGLSLLAQLRKSNGSAYDFLFVDDKNQLIGIQGTAAGKLRAVPSNGGFFWADPWKINDSTKVTEYMVQFVFKSVYLSDQVAFQKCDFDIVSTVRGLEDLNLTAETGGSTGVFKVTAKTKIGDNLSDLYPAVLAGAGAAALWKPKNFQTGVAIPVTSVALGTNTAGEACFILTLTSADANYPTTAGHFITLDITTPSALQTAGVDGYESTGAVKIVKN